MRSLRPSSNSSQASACPPAVTSTGSLTFAWTETSLPFATRTHCAQAKSVLSPSGPDAETCTSSTDGGFVAVSVKRSVLVEPAWK